MRFARLASLYSRRIRDTSLEDATQVYAKASPLSMANAITRLGSKKRFYGRNAENGSDKLVFPWTHGLNPR